MLLALSCKRAVDERFRIALNGGERRAQLVRDVDDEIFPDAFQLFEFGMLGLQLLHGTFQLGAGFVELAAQQSEFAAMRLAEPRVEIAVREFAGEPDDPAEFGGMRRAKKAARITAGRNAMGALQHFPPDGVHLPIDSVIGTASRRAPSATGTAT